MIVVIFLASCAILFLGYNFYGKLIEKWIGADAEKKTPAKEFHDGIDYVSTPAPILFGHHFSSIAGAGPIVGPVIASLMFGWGPALLWILLGAVFIGGVHDYVSLMASVRHRGKSLADICRHYFSPSTYYIMLIFIWLALIYVIVVFLDLTATTFAPDVTAIADESRKASELFSGGVVATASTIYVILALLFGLSVHKLKVNYKIASLIFVPMVFIGILIGHIFPLHPQSMPLVMVNSAKNMWLIILLIYCFCASVTPVWLLLQPRDFLSSFLLYACLITGGCGLVMAGFSGGLKITYPCFTGFTPEKIGLIFPVLFITVACGAVSGFHSLVAAGTTSKQLSDERDALPIAFGGMLLEGVLAVIAVVAVMILKKSEYGDHPVTIFASAIGRFGETCGLSKEAGINFGKLAISTFLLTTLDTCARIARFILDELIHHVTFSGKRFITTALTLIFPGIICFVSINGLPAWQAIWPAFGATNQLLAGIALLIVTTWLITEKRTTFFVAIPMIFMLASSGTALIILAYSRLKMGDYLIGILSVVMFLLAVCLVMDAAKSIRRRCSS